MGKIAYSYENIAKKKIIIREFFGEMTVNEIIDSFNYILDENMISKDCVGIVTDTSNAELKVSIKELSKVIQFLKQNQNFKSQKLAIIVDTPGKIILPMIAGKALKSINLRPFSTRESAYQWMLE